MAEMAEHPILSYAHQIINIPGDVIECGSWKLDSALKIAMVCPEKLVYACDTFHGMPVPTEIDGHREGDFMTSWQEVCAIAEGTNVVPVPGLFKYTLPLLAEAVGASTGFSMIYIDCDLYESAKQVIDILWPCLAEHGLLVADDYLNPACQGIRKVMDHYFAGRFTPDENGFVAVAK